MHNYEEIKFILALYQNDIVDEGKTIDGFLNLYSEIDNLWFNKKFPSYEEIIINNYNLNKYLKKRRVSLLFKLFHFKKIKKVKRKVNFLKKDYPKLLQYFLSNSIDSAFEFWNNDTPKIEKYIKSNIDKIDWMLNNLEKIKNINNEFTFMADEELNCSYANDFVYSDGGHNNDYSDLKNIKIKVNDANYVILIDSNSDSDDYKPEIYLKNLTFNDNDFPEDIDDLIKKVKSKNDDLLKTKREVQIKKDNIEILKAAQVKLMSLKTILKENLSREDQQKINEIISLSEDNLLKSEEKMQQLIYKKQRKECD